MSLLKLFLKNSANMFNKTITSLSDAASKFDVNEFETQCDKFSEELNKEIDKFKTKLKGLNLAKRLNDKCIFSIPFNKDNEKLSYTLDNDKLIVTVIKNITEENRTVNEERKTEMTIPSEILNYELLQNYNDKEKKMYFIFKNNKKIKTNDDKQERNVKDNTDLSEKIKKRKNIIEKVLHMRKNGCSLKKIAEEINVSERTISRWLKTFDDIK